MDSIKEWVLIAPEEKVPTLVRFLEDEIGPALPCVLAKKVGTILLGYALHPSCLDAIHLAAAPRTAFHLVHRHAFCHPQ